MRTTERASISLKLSGLRSIPMSGEQKSASSRRVGLWARELRNSQSAPRSATGGMLRQYNSKTENAGGRGQAVQFDRGVLSSKPGALTIPQRTRSALRDFSEHVSGLNAFLQKYAVFCTLSPCFGNADLEPQFAGAACRSQAAAGRTGINGTLRKLFERASRTARARQKCSAPR